MKSSRSCWFAAVLGIIIMMTPMTTANYDDDYPGPEAVKGPVIIPINERKEIVLQKGQNFTLKCKGKRPIEFKQQKIAEEVVGSFTVKTIDGAGTTDYPYEKNLNLYNVDHYAVGYYACFDDTVNSLDILDNILEEPTDTDYVTYVYIYVNGTDVLFAPMSEFGKLIKDSKVVLQCRPTMPDVNITLSLDVAESLIDREKYRFNPKIGITINSDDLPEIIILICGASRNDKMEFKHSFVDKHANKDSPNVAMDIGSEYFLKGENFSLTCSVKYVPNLPIAFVWTTPRLRKPTDIESTNDNNVKPGQNVYSTLTIVNATKDDAGKYTCKLRNGPGSTVDKSVYKKYLDEAVIDLGRKKNELLELSLKTVSLKVEVYKAYPKPVFSFYRNNMRLDVNNSKFNVREVHLTGDILLVIKNLTINDTANYTIVADNGYKRESKNFDVRVIAPPVVTLWPNVDTIYHELNQERSLQCDVTGYPLPKVDWIYYTSDNNSYSLNGTDDKMSIYNLVSMLKINPKQSGNITCKATNMPNKVLKTATASKIILIYEIPEGFGIDFNKRWYPEGSRVSLTCRATIHEFKNLTWRGTDGNEIIQNVRYYTNTYSHVAEMKINQITLNQAGTYTCVGEKFNGSEVHESKNIEVEAKRLPTIHEPENDKDEVVEKFQHVEFSCIADAVPPPEIKWYKDGELLQNDTKGLIILDYLNHTVANSTIVIEKMQNENTGKYECSAMSEDAAPSKFINLKLPEPLRHLTAILGGVAAVIILLIVLVIYLTLKIRKEKKFRKELAAAGLLYFKEGVKKSLNPDLGIDEQAELLPYDEKFEFPAEKLILGKQLGAGAFGVVYKADARGIINAEETTPVAVKMVKKTADNMYIKALASELKIMVHLGKHINIVNLLGACTKNVGKRELIVIVEYCKFGNIHNYMQKHREVFIDQFTDNKEKNLGRVNRGYSCSSGSSGMNSDYFGMHTQATEHTMLNTANTNRSGRKVSETGYIQPEWRSNYESDYSFDGRNPRPLCSRDLLAWAFQIARGMEYLASRKVLHGDLAARNVLLAEDNIVKICDFGLARSIYKNDEYQKKENSPLPVKWLAIECMMDRIFSTQSDVWSFGIVLWEMFSLAKTPYPNMSPQNLLQWLSDGHRLEKPPYADDRLYDVMMRCWEHKPNARPSFTKLQEMLGSYLEDNVRNHYVDLNSAYMDMNVKADGEDYLAMVSAPDYNNLVTPSPHHYMNDVRSFFPPTPTQVPLDEEGYLQMTPVNPSIFSPRTQSTKFDFDAKKIDPKVAETRGASELTPMLTLSNLPARSGSDSDHEGGHSPYLKMCPRIAEEADDVFKPNQNNIKNIQNSAVSNPTYISIDLDMKKPQDINNYINVPNGLVK